MNFETVVWDKDAVKLIDQTRLPNEMTFRRCVSVEELWQAIRSMVVRGAPAIGIAAAMGAYLGVKDSKAKSGKELLEELRKVTSYLKTSRPTAVNLFWGLRRMEQTAEKNCHKPVADLKKVLLEEAEEIRREDDERCRKIGQAGQGLIESGEGILTHCNAGGLATSGYGTALAPMFSAHAQGKKFHVYVDETRPLLQGGRLTAWELMQAGIESKIICDNMVGSLMYQKLIQKVVVGADRIVANGDTANKIGTYGIAVLAAHHKIPFFVAAPGSTFDFSIHDGSQIPIEERSKDEVLKPFGQALTPPGADALNPAFDVTPHTLITAFITDRGIIRPPYHKTLKALKS